MSIHISEINMPQGDGSKLVLQIFPNGEVYDAHGIRLGIANWAEAIPAADTRPGAYAEPVRVFNDPWSGKMITTCSACCGKISLKDSFCRHCGASLRPPKEET